MKKETARNFWRRYLGLVCNGASSQYVENPSLSFVVEAKAGEYDEISDKEYDVMLKDCEQFSAIWRKEARREAGDIFLDALQMTNISREYREKLAELLAACSLHTDYLSKTESSVSSARPAGSRSDADHMEDLRSLSPREIYNALCRRIHGQEEAKRAAAMITYHHMKGRRSNAVFCGPSGCGKSELWRQLAKDFPGIVRIVDASRLSAEGWKGSFHLRDIFEGIPAGDIEARGRIIVLDEADKICCETAMGAGGTNYNSLVQNNLLKMLDGDIIEFGNEDNSRKAFKVDCSHVSVVLLGAFEYLLKKKSENRGGLGFGSASRIRCDYSNTKIFYEDLIAAGMRREIAGRINRIVLLHSLSVSDYRALLTGPIMEELQSMGHCRIRIDDHSADLLSKEASESKLGARWMRSQIMNALDDLMFDDPTANEYTVNYPTAE